MWVSPLPHPYLLYFIGRKKISTVKLSVLPENDVPMNSTYDSLPDYTIKKLLVKLLVAYINCKPEESLPLTTCISKVVILTLLSSEDHLLLFTF